MVERLLTVRNVGEALDVSDGTVRLWLKAGELSGIRMPGGWRITEAELAAFVAKHRDKTAERVKARRRAKVS